MSSSPKAGAMCTMPVPSRGGDVVAADDEVGALVRLHEAERRLVLQAQQLGALELLLHDGLLAEHALDEARGEDEALAAALHERILHVRVHGRGHVADERPRRGGPDGERDGRAAAHPRPRRGRVVRQREAHVDGVLGDVLVALRHLVAADGGAAARAVRDDLVPLVQQTLVPDLPQQPPHRLDVAVGVRVVGVLEVDPEADALGEALPLLQIRGHALLAELLNSATP